MCLYPKLIKNRKYTVTKKNQGEVPKCTDPRTLYVPVGCGKCMECMKQRARQWQIRLIEEIKKHKRGHKHFVTLTFSNESIKEIIKDIEGLTGYELDNEIATRAVRLFLERWRAKHKVSIKHWLTTELGHNGTQNIHLHGIIFTDKPEEIKKIWKYGHVWIGDYVGEATVNYIIKYCTKVDIEHKEYKAKILTSPGIGANYITTPNASNNKYNGTTTRETYITRQGTKVNLPIYYRNKIYNDNEREKLWIQKIDKNERWVDGVKISTAKGLDTYIKVLEIARRKNAKLGYGNDSINWERRKYENQLRTMNLEKRIADYIFEENIPQSQNPQKWHG